MRKQGEHNELLLMGYISPSYHELCIMKCVGLHNKLWTIRVCWWFVNLYNSANYKLTKWEESVFLTSENTYSNCLDPCDGQT